MRGGCFALGVPCVPCRPFTTAQPQRAPTTGGPQAGARKASSSSSATTQQGRMFEEFVAVRGVSGEREREPGGDAMTAVVCGMPRQLRMAREQHGRTCRARQQQHVPTRRWRLKFCGYARLAAGSSNATKCNRLETKMRLQSSNQECLERNSFLQHWVPYGLLSPSGVFQRYPAPVPLDRPYHPAFPRAGACCVRRWWPGALTYVNITHGRQMETRQKQRAPSI